MAAELGSTAIESLPCLLVICYLEYCGVLICFSVLGFLQCCRDFQRTPSEDRGAPDFGSGQTHPEGVQGGKTSLVAYRDACACGYICNSVLHIGI